MGISMKLASIPSEIFKDAVEIAKSSKLLPHDATHAAAAKEMNIRNIATNDDDFQRVDFLKIWKT